MEVLWWVWGWRWRVKGFWVERGPCMGDRPLPECTELHFLVELVLYLIPLLPVSMLSESVVGVGDRG